MSPTSASSDRPSVNSSWTSTTSTRACTARGSTTSSALSPASSSPAAPQACGKPNAVTRPPIPSAPTATPSTRSRAWAFCVPGTSRRTSCSRWSTWSSSTRRCAASPKKPAATPAARSASRWTQRVERSRWKFVEQPPVLREVEPSTAADVVAGLARLRDDGARGAALAARPVRRLRCGVPDLRAGQRRPAHLHRLAARQRRGPSDLAGEGGAARRSSRRICPTSRPTMRGTAPSRRSG